MKYILFSGLLSLLFAILLSCGGSSYPLVADTAMAEAVMLKKYCSDNKIKFPEIRNADSLSNSAKAQKEEGEQEAAFRTARFASTYYKMALLKHEQIQSEKRIHEKEAVLEGINDQLRMYRKLLHELEVMSK